MLKQIVKSLTDRMGYELIPKWRKPNLALSEHLRILMDMLQINCVFDVGANKGQYGRFLREEVGYKDLIISFEPIPEVFQELKKQTTGDTLWHAYQIALGNIDGDAMLNIMASTPFSSFHTPDTNKYFADLNRVVRQEKVNIYKLDSFVSEYRHKTNFSNCFLKMDTQGFDLEVLEGAIGTMRRLKALQSEISIIPLYSKAPDYFASIQRFNNLGFQLTGLFPVTRDSQLRVIEFDCIMVGSCDSCQGL